MRRRQFLLGSSAVLASGALLTGTTAFSSSELNRSVDIAVVADEYGYLGLSEDEDNDSSEATELLFGGGPQTAPVDFRVTNQTSSAVDMDIDLDTLVFTDRNNWSVDGSTEASIKESGHRVEITDLSPGHSVSGITVDTPGYGQSKFTDTLSFEVTGEHDSINIAADRALTLEVPEIEADVELNDTNSTADIDLSDSASVDNSTLTTTVEDCGSSNKTTVTVEGSTESGIPFSGTASDVDCSNS